MDDLESVLKALEALGEKATLVLPIQYNEATSTLVDEHGWCADIGDEDAPYIVAAANALPTLISLVRAEIELTKEAAYWDANERSRCYEHIAALTDQLRAIVGDSHAK